MNKQQIDSKIKFIKNYISASNAASGSQFDANANVSSKNISTMESELMKKEFIQINRRLLYDKIMELYSKELADEYIRQLESHEIYTHDETSLKPYCVSLTMYPFLIDGVTKLGGESKAPKHLASFCGTFINFVFAVASQFAGAVATVEFLMYFDYFARKDYGDDYLSTHTNLIEESLQHVIYSINQPAAARGYQSVFFNISIYDKPYFEAIFGDFVFPDFIKPEYDSVNKLQKFFMKWFNEERTKAVLTYPVITAACLTNEEDMVDLEFKDFIAEELHEGNSFFIFMSKNAHALSSCCRLKNDVSDQLNDFSYSLGAGGVSTGSINVITLNANRLVQDAVNNNQDIFDYLKIATSKIHKYQVAYRSIVQDYKDCGMLPVYDAEFISLDKQFLTIGINGLVESAEFLGYKIDANEEYMNYIAKFLGTISEANSEMSKMSGYKYNTEIVPGENLGQKNAFWDKKDGYKVPRECYNSYTYLVEDDNISISDKFILCGKDILKYLDGGSALHLNLEEHPSIEGYKKLIEIAAKEGTEYWCTNIKITICNDCGNIDKRTLQECPKCKSRDIDYGTRVIGYLKRVSAFSEPRQKEESLRYYIKEN